MLQRKKAKVMTMEKRTILRTGPSCQRGTALVLSLFLITVLTVIGTMVLNTSIVEIKMAQNQKISSQVFYAAEAGLERGLLMLIADFENDPSPWGNSNYAGWAETVTESANTGTTAFDPAIRSMDMYTDSPDANLRKLTLAGGHTVQNCTFDLYIYKQSATEAYVMSKASGNGGVAAVEYHLKSESVAPYDNAIFTNSGVSGHFQGSVNVAGSIYSRGTLDLGANVHVNNSYDDVRTGKTWADNPTLNSILTYESDLDTKLRVKGGDLLIGSAATQIGTAADPIEGFYVDGINQAESVGTHYADTWETEVPDLPMPSILDGLKDEIGDSIIDACIVSEGYTGDDSAIATSLYADWAEGTGCFTDSRGVVVSGDIVLDKNTASFSITDPDGNGLTYTAPPGGVGMGEITVQGTVVIDGDLIFGDNKLDGLNYIATGADTGLGSDAADGATLVVNGNFTANGEFYPDDGYLMGDLYPGTNDINSLGIVTTGDVTFTGHNDDVHAGFFFVEGQTNFNKQSKFAGTVISNLVNYAQVPDVYQVPNLKNYLPPAIPGGTAVMALRQREWRRVY